jgi:O-antigen/teichoic acid export membrane protein
VAAVPEQTMPEQTALERRSIDTSGRTLREHAARGTIVNAGFLIGITTLGLLRGFVVAVFLTRSDFAIWGILVIGLGTLGWIKGSAISDKYVQQDELDQELAFQKAFTFELLLAGLVGLLVLAAIPLIAIAYNQPRVIAPGAVAALIVVPAMALQTPLWIFYRRMEFVRQRSLQAVDPVTSFVVTIALAAAGLGYWSLVLGTIAGACAGAVVAIRALPYRLALRYDRGTLREYVSFSLPVFVAGLAGLVFAQSSLLVGNSVLGLGAVGAISLASAITAYADQLDGIVTATLYPAICAVKDRTDLLFETFVKSNRLALMWGVPFGVGVALFAPDLVHYALGHKWDPAIRLIQVFGLIAASHQIGFNWSAFYRARGETRPLAVTGVAVTAVFLASVIPLTILDGLDGFAIALAISAAGNLIARSYYLVRLFPGFAMLRHALRAIAPSLPAAGAVLALRLVEHGPRSAGLAIAELALYAVVTIGATFAFERPLLTEIAGYLRPRPT